jgi:anti-sigma B factor antagonist
VAPIEQHDVRAGMLTLRSELDSSTYTIRLVGELDLANADAFDAALEEAFAAEVPHIVVDMEELTFIDSTGLALLVAALGRSQGNGRLRFVPSQAEAVARVLRLTGIEERLPLVES